MLDTACPLHGPYTFYERPGRAPERRCLACRREAHGTRHNSTPFCYVGHRKTPWTWRMYGGRFRCLPCHNAAARARNARRRLTRDARLAA